jgi:hypothetical protein
MKDLLSESLMASLVAVQPDARMGMAKPEPVTPHAGFCSPGSCKGICGGNCIGMCGSNCKGGMMI